MHFSMSPTREIFMTPTSVRFEKYFSTMTDPCVLYMGKMTFSCPFLLQRKITVWFLKASFYNSQVVTDSSFLLRQQ